MTGLTTEPQRWRPRRFGIAGALLIVLASIIFGPRFQGSAAQAPAAGVAGPKTVWYFYRVKWGFQDEFQSLFARNHLPVLREQTKSGRLLSVKTFVPSYHGDGRADWTFAVEIVFKDAATFVTPADDQAIQKRLFTDLDRFRREEQRRFEILDAHWDVPLNALDLK